MNKIKILYLCNNFDAAQEMTNMMGRKIREIIPKAIQVDLIGRRIETPYATIDFISEGNSSINRDKYQMIFSQNDSSIEPFIEAALGEIV